MRAGHQCDRCPPRSTAPSQAPRMETHRRQFQWRENYRLDKCFEIVYPELSAAQIKYSVVACWGASCCTTQAATGDCAVRRTRRLVFWRLRGRRQRWSCAGQHPPAPHERRTAAFRWGGARICRALACESGCRDALCNATPALRNTGRPLGALQTQFACQAVGKDEMRCR